MNTLQKQLFELQDLKYKDFHSKLIPGYNKENIIGIRTPILRKFAKEYAKTKDSKSFIKDLPHTYYEENNLHMMIISGIKDYDECIKQVKLFIPYINNWATCDLPLPKCFSKHKDELLVEIKKWINSSDTYTIRYGIGTLMSLYLDDDFKPEYVELVSNVKSEEYYVNMMIAWYPLLLNSGTQLSLILSNANFHHGFIEKLFKKLLKVIGLLMSRKFT